MRNVSAAALLVTGGLLAWTTLATSSTSAAASAAADKCTSPTSAHLPADATRTSPAKDPVEGPSKGWAGYVILAQKPDSYSSVGSTWNVPRVKTKKDGNQSADDWVGIDGLKVADFDPNTLLQIGTASDNENGKAIYYSWWEAPTKKSMDAGTEHQTEIGNVPIHAGDEVAGAVYKGQNGKWILSIENVTTLKSCIVEIGYKTPGREADVIHERPIVKKDGKLTIATLASTSNVTFSGTNVASPPRGYPVALGDAAGPGATLYRLFMTSDDGTGKVRIAAPSKFTNGLCFTVADGEKPPSPPTQKACPVAG